MNWVNIKKALNSTLGTSFFKPLNKMIEEESYNSYYKTMESVVGGYGDNDGGVLIVPRGTLNIANSKYSSNSAGTIVIPWGVKTIGNYSFEFMANAKGSLEIPGSVTKIGEGAFRSTPFDSIFFHEGLQEIASQAFAYCGPFDEIRLPSTIKSISNTAFLEVTITSLYVPWSEGDVAGAPWGAKNATIYYNSTID